MLTSRKFPVLVKLILQKTNKREFEDTAETYKLKGIKVGNNSNII